ncbi:MAG: apolipoprotein N-acyltransferase [Actinomycetota bacterium]
MIKQLAWRIPIGILAGLVGLYIFPTENIWALAPLVPALVLIATLGLSFLPALAIGFIAGQAFYISHIEWLSLYLGPIPLIALSTLMSIYFALGVAVTAWLYLRLKPKKRGLLVFAFASASIWTLREWLASNFPYGGFPWSRLGMTQSDSFIAGYAWWGGISLISFALAFIGAALALILLNLRKLKRKEALVGFSAVAAVAAFPLATPYGLGLTQVGEIRIAAVQGNANAGLFSNLSRGTILKNHLDATYQNVSPESDLDLIVWPENAADLSPLYSDQARAEIEDLVETYGAPITFGTITERGGEVYNSTIFWEAEGPTDYYDKKRPVPFAEYVPDREFWRQFAPDLIDLVSRGYAFGTKDGIFETTDFVAGSLICFEIAEDDIPRGLALEGAQLILSQTNNADFGYSDETFQQAAIARLRAIEAGRVVVNISTVGLSAIYLPNGQVLDELEWFTSAAMIQEVPLYQGATPATGLGLWFDAINATLAASFLALGLRRRRR